MTAVIDASALIAVLLNERGAQLVISRMRGALMSALNASECYSRAVERGYPADAVEALLGGFELHIVPFDLEQARIAAELKPETRSVGASLGDRAALALSRLRQLPLLTGDRDLRKLDIGVEIILIR